MRLVCLVGRHGSGKSAVGSLLVERGFKHYSMGLLRRLARQRTFPNDVPVSLLLGLASARPGVPLAQHLVRKLIDHCAAIDRCVLDGFPSTLQHLAALPAYAEIWHVLTPRRVREERLAKRSDTTNRIWTPGLTSPRDLALAEILAAARRTHSVRSINNGAHGLDELEGRVDHLLS